MWQQIRRSHIKDPSLGNAASTVPPLACLPVPVLAVHIGFHSSRLLTTQRRTRDIRTQKHSSGEAEYQLQRGLLPLHSDPFIFLLSSLGAEWLQRATGQGWQPLNTNPSPRCTTTPVADSTNQSWSAWLPQSPPTAVGTWIFLTLENVLIKCEVKAAVFKSCARVLCFCWGLLHILFWKEVPYKHSNKERKQLYSQLIRAT